jgi:hypothetical protein
MRPQTQIFFLVLLFFEHDSSLVFLRSKCLFFPAFDLRSHCQATHTDMQIPTKSTLLSRFTTTVSENLRTIQHFVFGVYRLPDLIACSVQTNRHNIPMYLDVLQGAFHRFGFSSTPKLCKCERCRTRVVVRRARGDGFSGRRN